MMKVKFLYKQAVRQIQRMRNILAILLAMFVCTSICLGQGQTITIRRDICDWNDELRRKHEEAWKKDKLQKWEEQYVVVPKEMEKKREEVEVGWKMAVQNGSWHQWLGDEVLKWKDVAKELITNEEELRDWNEKVEEAGAKEDDLMGCLDKLLVMVVKDEARKEKLERLTQEWKQRLYPNIAGNGDPNQNSDNCGKVMNDDDDDDDHGVWNNPNDNRLIINPGAKVGSAFGAKMDMASVDKNGYFLSMTNNEVIVSGGEFGYDGTNGYIAGAFADDDIVDLMNISSNTVIITGGIYIKDVYGGRAYKGTVSSNTVIITGGADIRNVCGGVVIKGTVSSNTVTISSDARIVDDVCGGAVIGGDGLASSNTVTITSGTVGRNVCGGYIRQNGTATLNTVNLTSVTAVKDVYGARIGNGLASSNTVTVRGGKVKGNVFGGYVEGNGKAIYNTINITATELSSKQSSELSSPEFSPESILCGGICADAATNDAFTGNTLNIETKGIEVKGISNFEKYNFYLSGVELGKVILTATSGGCSWNTDTDNYTPTCAVDLSRSNIYLHTQGVLNKGDSYTLIKSPKGFKNNRACKQFEFENEGLLVKYHWDIKITDDEQNLTAKLIDKKIRDEGIARSLSEGYGAGIVCTNNGMDCIINKMEGSELLLGEGEGEIGVFYGLAANKSRYNTGSHSHIDMIGISMMGGIGIGREKRSVTGVFGEHGTGDSDIHSGLSPCEKRSEGKSSYVGGGLLEKYAIYEDEFSGTKVYVETILRAGRVNNSFKSKEAKDSTGKEYEYDDATSMYLGCAVGGGYKHKVSDKIDLDWSLRYMSGYQDEKDVKRVDADGNKVDFESVTSNRIRLGVRGKCVKLEKVKPYVGIGCECELSGKVEGAIENGADTVGDIPTSSFGGWTGIGEVGASGKVWKLGVDISGQGYLGVRKGFGGMLKLKYAFGKDAHGSLASSKSPRSKAPRS